MGRQKGNAVFLGTYAGITGFADEGKGFWRRRTSLDGDQWRGMDSMQSCRDAAVLFGAASTMAGCLWRYLPDGMKRLADGGGYNRLVAACRALIGEEGLTMDDGQWTIARGLGEFGGTAQLWDVDGLRGLDLSVESMGPHFLVQSSGSRIQSYGREKSRRCFECTDLLARSLSATRFSAPAAPSVEMTGWRLMGLDALFSQMDEALGECAGRKSGKFAVARRVSPSRVLDEGEVLAQMGSMEGWRGVRGVKSEQLEVKSGEGEAGDSVGSGLRSRLHRDGQRRAVDGAAAGAHALVAPERRVRVWVHAVRLVPLVWVEGMECFVPSDDVQPFTNGFVTDWIVGGGGVKSEKRKVNSEGRAEENVGWKAAYDILGSEWRRDGTPTRWDAVEEGAYVVFTAIEVAEKRGRHWVRLPWCCKFRVQDVVSLGSGVEISSVDYGDGNEVVGIGQFMVDDMGWGWVRFEDICLKELLPQSHCQSVEEFGRLQSKGIRAGP